MERRWVVDALRKAVDRAWRFIESHERDIILALLLLVVVIVVASIRHEGFWRPM